MYMEPGVMEAAKHAGIKKGALHDANLDGKIMGDDVNIQRTNMVKGAMSVEPAIASKRDLAMGLDAKASKGMAVSNSVKTPANC